MTAQEWIAFLSTLDQKCRRLSQAIIARAQYILNRDRIAYLDEIQRVERRQAVLKEDMRSLEARLSARIDTLEQQAGHGG